MYHVLMLHYKNLLKIEKIQFWQLHWRKHVKVYSNPQQHRPTTYQITNFWWSWKESFDKNEVTYEQIPPYINVRNAAEQAIRTFKNHFLEGLISIYPSFQITHWDQLLEQTEITLNHLRTLGVNSKLSSCAYLFGNFDSNKSPLVPPRTKVAVHMKPEKIKL